MTALSEIAAFADVPTLELAPKASGGSGRWRYWEIHGNLNSRWYVVSFPIHAIQPEYMFAASIASPVIYLSKEFRSSALVASGIVFFVVGVERGVVGSPQFVEYDFLMDVKNLYPIGNIISFCYLKI